MVTGWHSLVDPVGYGLTWVDPGYEVVLVVDVVQGVVVRLGFALATAARPARRRAEVRMLE